MTKTTLTAAAFVLTLIAAPASATGAFSSTAIQGQGQAQGQLQGQAQNTSTSVNVEGSVSASVGGATCTNGISIGAPGVGAFGITLSDRNCRIVAEAALIADLGYTGMAMSHLTNIPRVAATVRASQQPVASSSAPAPVAVAYRSCAMEGGQLVVRVARGADQALAARQCAALFN